MHHVISALTITKIFNISKKNENNALLIGTKIKHGKEYTILKEFIVITLRLTTKNEVANRILLDVAFVLQSEELS